MFISDGKEGVSKKMTSLRGNPGLIKLDLEVHRTSKSKSLDSRVRLIKGGS